MAYFSLVAEEYAALGTRITLYICAVSSARPDNQEPENMKVVLGVSSNRRNGMIKESSLVDASRGTMIMGLPSLKIPSMCSGRIPGIVTSAESLPLVLLWFLVLYSLPLPTIYVTSLAR